MGHLCARMVARAKFTGRMEASTASGYVHGPVIVIDENGVRMECNMDKVWR